MRASGWVLIAMVVCAVPLAIGVATGQSWPPYVTYAGWGVVIVTSIVRALLPKRGSRPTSSAIAGAGDVYNELYLARPRIPVTFGNPVDVTDGETLDRPDELADGKVTLSLPDENQPS
ncbi:hypothetical protein [Parafrigoribacterium soli]|jgi:hypothetical protein|uniref:hypothetical protein n=1 Tax=Parafrigoribacterium soli TaxID=3144663 RepID=UPI0032EFEB11